MPDNPRTNKDSTPAPLVFKAVALGALALGVILYSTWHFGSSIYSAKMKDTIVAKEYRPFAAAENQITLNRDGSSRSDQVDGEHLITVAVPRAGCEKKLSRFGSTARNAMMPSTSAIPSMSAPM